MVLYRGLFRQPLKLVSSVKMNQQTKIFPSKHNINCFQRLISKISNVIVGLVQFMPHRLVHKPFSFLHVMKPFPEATLKKEFLPKFSKKTWLLQLCHFQLNVWCWFTVTVCQNGQNYAFVPLSRKYAFSRDRLCEKYQKIVSAMDKRQVYLNGENSGLRASCMNFVS